MTQKQNPPILKNTQFNQDDLNQLNNWMQWMAKNQGVAGGVTPPAQISVTQPLQTVIQQQAITMNTPFNVVNIPFTLNQANYSITTDGIFAFDFTGTLSTIGTFNIVFNKPLLFIVDNKTVGNFGITITNGLISYSLPAASGSKILYYDGNVIEDALNIINTSSNGIPVRQTVLYSPVDTAGLPTFLPASSTAATQLNAPWGFAIDNVNNEIIVANQIGNSITVYSRTANGNTVPIRTISGLLTTLSSPRGLNIDTVNNEIAVINNANSIVIFSRTANGNVAPLRTISGAATGLNNPYDVFIDTINNEIGVTNPTGQSITIHSRTANGNIAPLRTITGAATGLNSPYGIYIDTANNEIGIGNFGNSITIFSRTANGNVAPLRTITGAATGLNGPWGIYLDAINNEIGIINNTGNSVSIFNRTANGNIAPLRTITGIATGLSIPIGISLDTINNEIGTISANLNTIEVFSRTANGNIAPLRSIGGLTLSTINVTSTATLVATASYRDSDNKGTSITNLTWPQCTNTATNYLPLLVSNGLLTPQPPVILAPIYQWGGTPAVTAGQYTFKIQEMTMYLGNGTTANQVSHVIVGEAVAAGGNITSTVAYALQGRYYAQQATLALATNYTFASSLGIPTQFQKLYGSLYNKTAEFGYGVGYRVPFANASDGAAGSALNWYGTIGAVGGRNVTYVTTGNGAVGSVSLATGAIAGFTTANWGAEVLVIRGF